MNLTGVGSANPLLKQLGTNGVSASKAKLVQSDLTAAEGASSNGAGATTSLTPSVRAAFDAKIATDVLSGKLTKSDAAAVKKTMDGLGGGGATAATGQADAPAASPQVSGSGGGHGGGDGGASAKTELSELVTVSGSTMTTVITYTDGTTSSTTTVATASDEVKYGQSSNAASANGGSNRYVAAPTIDKGSLVDQVA